jgi:hypothetical protein
MFDNQTRKILDRSNAYTVGKKGKKKQEQRMHAYRRIPWYTHRRIFVVLFSFLITM